MVALLIHESFSTTGFKMAMKHYHYFGDDAQSRQLLGIMSEKSFPYALGRDLLLDGKAECQIKKWFSIHLQAHNFQWHV